jgi:hypothetical protein
VGNSSTLVARSLSPHHLCSSFRHLPLFLIILYSGPVDKDWVALAAVLAVTKVLKRKDVLIDPWH